jgi:chromosome segregation ATPase
MRLAYMLKNWFLLASVSCGVGFGSTFLISRNLQQSTWAGLGTVPAVAASMKILSRQRKEEIERQVTKFRLSLDNTQQQERLAKEEIERQVTKSRLSLEEIERQVAKSRSSLDDARQQEQLVKDSCGKISAHGQKLQTGFTQLRQEVDRYRVRQAELEQEINSLVLHKQTQESLLVQLDGKVLDKQNQLETTNTELDRIQAQRQLQIDSGRQSNLQLQSIREDIRQNSVIKEELESQFIELQNQLQILQQSKLTLANIHEELTKHSVNRENLKAEIAALEKREENLQAEIAAQKVEHTELQQQLSVLKQQKEQVSIAVDSLDRSVKDRQSLSNDLDLEILNRRQIKEDITSQIKELEESILLVSGHEVDEVLNIGVTHLYQQWQAFNLQLSELKEQISQLTQQKELIQSKKWEKNLIFENNPHLQILAHIDRHEAIAESEVNHILGNSRKSREFAIRLRDYLPHLPFSVRVETSNSGNRYVKAIITIVKPQNLPDVLQPDVVEIELSHSQTTGSMPALEALVIQDADFDLRSQSNDDSIERIMPIYNTCRSCERTPMYGHDYCSTCS